MRWHNVLFRLSALISRLPSLCSEDEASTLYFLVRCWITLSQCLFAASKVDPLSRLPLEHLIIHKGHSGMKSKAEGRRDEGNWQNTLQDKSARWVQIFRFQCHSSHNKTLLSIPESQNWELICLSIRKRIKSLLCYFIGWTCSTIPE